MNSRAASRPHLPGWRRGQPTCLPPACLPTLCCPSGTSLPPLQSCSSLRWWACASTWPCCSSWVRAAGREEVQGAAGRCRLQGAEVRSRAAWGSAACLRCTLCWAHGLNPGLAVWPCCARRAPPRPRRLLPRSRPHEWALPQPCAGACELCWAVYVPSLQSLEGFRKPPAPVPASGLLQPCQATAAARKISSPPFKQCLLHPASAGARRQWLRRARRRGRGGQWAWQGCCQAPAGTRAGVC